MTTQVGVISDTHGLLRAEVMAALRGCSLILHAGDVGGEEVLLGLAEIAPVLAVRGNVDGGAWAAELPLQRTVSVEEARLHLMHDVASLRFGPAPHTWQAVIYGHSHRPSLEERGGVLFLNPGAAGPRRFYLPVSLAVLEIEGSVVRARLVTVEP